jgi:hypothetical protein
MKIRSSAATQSYRWDYGTSFGIGAELGTYGEVSLDNYKSGTAMCIDAIGAMPIKPSKARDLSLPN